MSHSELNWLAAVLCPSRSIASALLPASQHTPISGAYGISASVRISPLELERLAARSPQQCASKGRFFRAPSASEKRVLSKPDTFTPRAPRLHMSMKSRQSSPYAPRSLPSHRHLARSTPTPPSCPQAKYLGALRTHATSALPCRPTTPMTPFEAASTPTSSRTVCRECFRVSVLISSSRELLQ